MRSFERQLCVRSENYSIMYHNSPIYGHGKAFGFKEKQLNVNSGVTVKDFNMDEKNIFLVSETFAGSTEHVFGWPVPFI